MPAAAKSTLVAVDTNFLFDLADDTAIAWEALETIRARIKSLIIVVPPTVIDELVAAHDNPEEGEEQRLAMLALQRLRSEWKFQPVDFVPVGHGIVGSVAGKIRDRGYIPLEEVNDSFVLAESALLACTLLITSDGHLIDVPAGPLKLLLDTCDVACPLIVSPRKIAKEFFPKK